jgi:ubiquinone/menaquinone biosynthesis C-methylase UbiE
MEAIGRVPDGAVIVDAPCGAGPAFRGLRADQEVRYLALDLSPAMLRRARSKAQERGLMQVELVEGDAAAIPLASASAALFLSYWGLHCFADPEAALDEAERCLEPGGNLVGGAIVSGSSLRQRLLVHPHRGAFGAVASASDLHDWLTSRFDQVELEVSGAMAFFTARRR